MKAKSKINLNVHLCYISNVTKKKSQVILSHNKINCYECSLGINYKPKYSKKSFLFPKLYSYWYCYSDTFVYDYGRKQSVITVRSLRSEIFHMGEDMDVRPKK